MESHRGLYLACLGRTSTAQLLKALVYVLISTFSYHIERIVHDFAGALSVFAQTMSHTILTTGRRLYIPIRSSAIFPEQA